MFLHLLKVNLLLLAGFKPFFSIKCIYFEHFRSLQQFSYLEVFLVLTLIESSVTVVSCFIYGKLNFSYPLFFQNFFQVFSKLSSLIYKDIFYWKINFNYMLLSCHVHVSEWIYTLLLPECQGTPCTKQAWYLKFKWQQLDLNPQLFSL